jgi:hypothetical protein
MKPILLFGLSASGLVLPSLQAESGGSGPYDPPAAMTAAQEPGATGSARFRDALMPPPAGWAGHVFHLSQDYPVTMAQDTQPWRAFDPTTEPGDYLKAVLVYFFEGNIRDNAEACFDPALNPVRKWYHAPWQDYGLNGREFIHGLTRERTSLPGELSSQQDLRWSNYAVGYYNGPGGYALGQIWADHRHPAPALSSMPEGTVAAELLFTTAPTSQVPYLAGAPPWQAYIYSNPNDAKPQAGSPRSVLTVRLFQIDLAVKDYRSPTGWVFGTFVYGGGPNGPPGSGWTNVAPVGLMWGDDPSFTGEGELTQTWLNRPAVNMPHYGYQGRLNGPTDNPASSCLSCHATAETPPPAAMIPVGNPVRWFENIPSGTPFDPGNTALDYSLQVQVGLQNFNRANQLAAAPNPAARAALVKGWEALDAVPPRDGGK